MTCERGKKPSFQGRFARSPAIDRRVCTVEEAGQAKVEAYLGRRTSQSAAICLLAVCVASALIIPAFAPFDLGRDDILGENSASIQYTGHDPIIIDGDEDFTSANGVTGGSGTEANPYVIEGWTIEAFESACIEITLQQTYEIVYLNLRNLHLIQQGNQDALILRGFSGAIYPDDPDESEYGGLQVGIANCIIEGEALVDIIAVEIENCGITGRLTVNCGSLYLNNTESRITNNTIGVGDIHNIGLTVMYSNAITIENNDVVGDVILSSSTHCTLAGNTISGRLSLSRWDGLDNYDTLSITANNVDCGGPVRYFKNQDSLYISQEMASGTLILANCSAVTASMLQVSDSSSLTIAYADHVSFSGCMFRNTSLQVYNSRNVSVTACEFSGVGIARGNTHIQVFRVQDFSVVLCSFDRGYTALDLQFVDGASVMGNEMDMLAYSILADDCSDMKLQGNALTGSDAPLGMEGCANCTVFQNNIKGDIDDIWVDDCENISWDGGYPAGGNYWLNWMIYAEATDRYVGPYQDTQGSDGICDKEYSLRLSTADRYPLMEPCQYFRPRAAFSIAVIEADGSYQYSLDSSSVWDAVDTVEALQVRWDYDGDGEWDTDWATDKVLDVEFARPGNYTVRLEVMNSIGFTTVTEKSLLIDGNNSENWLWVLLLIAAVIVAVLAVALKLNRRPKSPLRDEDIQEETW